MNGLGRILLVEDDPKDIDLTLRALEQYKLANEVVVARDGEEALDYLERPRHNGEGHGGTRIGEKGYGGTRNTDKGHSGSGKEK